MLSSLDRSVTDLENNELKNVLMIDGRILQRQNM